jgi:hypothetical protein
LKNHFDAMKLINLILVLFAVVNISTAAIYHVDARSGDDSNSGVSPRKAWKTLAHVNAQVFKPGDEIRFKAGTQYRGQLKPQGSGALINGKPVAIKIGKYGRGPKPRIDGAGEVLDTLLLRNVEYWEVADLEITNHGTNRQPWQTGVRIVADGIGAMRHIRIKRLFVHDVSGDLRKTHEGCGIYFESLRANNSHFQDLRIEDCHVVRTDRNGICQRTSGRTRSTGVIIRGNLLEDIGGDAIKLWGSNGGLIESNVVRGARTRCEDYAAGIWPFDSDDTLVQFNEVSGVKGTKDGQGFDSDYRCRRSIFQYNYSHDNEGGFMLICAPGNSWNEDTVIRYNISQNDGSKGARIFHFGGAATNTLVYNNTIYIGTNRNVPLMLFTEWDRGWAGNTKFFNNVFYVDGRATYDFGRSKDITFEFNTFYGEHANSPVDSHAITNRPPFLKPGSGSHGFKSLKGYTVGKRNAAPRGKLVPNNGGRDFFGNQVPPNHPPTIGAFEATK